jgi:Mg-chelatase subunit ChlD
MLVLVAITLVIFIVAVVFSIDVAYMQLVRAQLRAAADAAARAGAQALSMQQSDQAAIDKAIEIGALNYVAGQPLQLSDDDIELGRPVPQADGSWQFVAGAQPYGAVRVHAFKSTSTAAGPVRLLLGGLLGRTSFEPEQYATASQVDQDIVLVVDRSGSMAWDLSGEEWHYPPASPDHPTGEDLPPHPTLSRWSAAVAAIGEFVVAINSTNPNEQVAMVTFSSDSGAVLKATIDSALGFDYTQITGALADLSSQPIRGGTNIAAGIDFGVAALEANVARRYAQKTMIVMTDGQWNQGRDPREAARDAAGKGIRIHAITFSDNADESSMRDVAAIGGGKHYHAPDAQSLKDIYREIALTLQVILTE